jgi:DNA-binding transcriptional MerR regulator
MENSLLAIPAKRYFTIGEVAELCGVKSHVLRYWEQEFTQLRPMKRRGNRRYYQHHEVLMIRRIRDLLYDQGFTISGARNKLQELVAGVRIMPEPVGGLVVCELSPDEGDVSFDRLYEEVMLDDVGATASYFTSIRQELFEIRKLLSEVL